MFTSQCINLFDWFYPIGNTPAVSLTQSLPLKVAAKILLLGCGDLRNILFTVHLDGEFQLVRCVSACEVPSLTENPDRPLDITSCDLQKAVIARNVLLLTLIIDDVDANNDTSIWNICYQMRIDKKSDDLLKDQASKLLELSMTWDIWKQSKYGSQLKFCDTATLADVRTMWTFYSSSRTEAETSNINKRLDAAVNFAKKMKVFPEDRLILTGLRSAAPAHLLAFRDMDALHKHFWTHGTLHPTNEEPSSIMLPNRMFLAGADTPTLHYGTDPLLGFHLATAYAPLEPHSSSNIQGKGSDQLQKVIETARIEFKQWAASFRRKSGAITVRFFAGDAIAFAYTLQHTRASGSATAGFYRDNYQFEPLTLIESDYSATGSAPLTFDVVDTSNLCDHIGALNVLAAVSPLLANNLASTVYTEVIPKSAKSRKEMMDTMLCGDTPTVSTLLALFPAEYWTNASGVSYGDETSFDSPDDKQMFLRVAWKRPPCLASSGHTSSESLIPIGFAEEDLADILYRIYTRMFDNENWEKAFASLRLGRSEVSQDLNPQPRYHRASLAAFLRLVQHRVACDWEKTMRRFHDMVAMRGGSLMDMVHLQELCAYLHVLHVHTVDVYKYPELVPGMSTTPPGGQHLRSWKGIAPVVYVTLKVPRKHIKVFTDEDRLAFGRPTVRCKISDGASWENIFPACQSSFGEVSTRGIRHSDGYEVLVNEDKTGWDGDSALIVTFCTPSWAILRDYDSTTVAFGIRGTPLLIKQFKKHYGLSLTIYETAMKNSDNVYITKYAPHQRAFPKVHGFTVDQVLAPGDIGGNAVQKLTANGDPQIGCLATMIGRLDINSEKLRAILKDGAPVTVDNPTPCHATVALGQEQPLDLFFPVPVLSKQQKVRVARKSSYVEVIAQVATVSSSAEFPTSFVYPLYLTGSQKVPLAWSMPHLDLQKQPSLNLGQISKMDWLHTHLYMQMSGRERTLRKDESLSRSPGEQVRLDFKESLFTIFGQFAGLQGSEGNIFGISIPGKGGIMILIFPNKLRIDLTTRTIVMDCAVLPVREDIVPKLKEFLKAIGTDGIVQIVADDAELSMWKQVLPSWVERCRTDWSHRDDCEYRATGKIPRTDPHDNAQFLCSCGQGVFPGDFILADVPLWLSMASKYSTRAAISPLFWAPFADEMYTPQREGSGTSTPSGGCKVCGMRQKKDGKKLMKCGNCRLVEYCSVKCQKKDWKAHKPICSATRAS